MERTRVGIIGCGNISGIYLKAGKTFDNLEIAACADIDLDRAKAKAAELDIPKACTVDELLADRDISIVVNLTIPRVHAGVCAAAIAAGKHVHVEKPLAVNIESGTAVVKAATDRGLRLGCAPDTFLGAGLQTCRKLIDDGWIGEPVAATAFMMSHGPEGWHPDPEFFFDVGGGPMFDMGPYYLTALVSLLGPVGVLSGTTRISFPTRTIGSEKKRGAKIEVAVPTHVIGTLQFESGPLATIVTSFDVWAANTPLLEIYGSEGSLSLPDPNGFGGPVRVRRMGAKEWSEVPLTHSYAENSRGIGVADMAASIAAGRPHRCSAEMAMHVLEIMEGIHVSASTECHYHPSTRCTRPEPMPMGLRAGLVEL